MSKMDTYTDGKILYVKFNFSGGAIKAPTCKMPLRNKIKLKAVFLVHICKMHWVDWKTRQPNEINPNWNNVTVFSRDSAVLQ